MPLKTYKLLKALNLVFSILIVILATIILIRPLLPDMILAASANEFLGYAYHSETTFTQLGKKAEQLPELPKDNRLVIPRIYVNASVTEGFDETALERGMWRRPNTSTPDKGGNTVITGHRFLYTTGATTFYHLDKIALDDLILVYWEGKEYTYKVYEVSEVEADQIEVEYSTKDSILTLYTCTPIWTTEKRLVVKARLQ